MTYRVCEATRPICGQDTTITETTGTDIPRSIAEPADDGLWYMDLHSHSSDASDDAGGTVEGYLKWIVARRKRGFRVDGFVLTEHRQFDRDVDYSEMADRYGVTVLRAAELETDIGHVLVYGISEELERRFDFTSVALPHRELFQVARETGGFAIAAHAGRPRIGLAHYVEEHGLSPDGVEVIEQLNGGSSDAENARGRRLAERYELRSVGGSDAHFVSAIGRCLTAFRRPITSIEALVDELAHGEYHPVTVEQTLAAAPATER